MRPRTKIQKAVAEIFHELSPIDEKTRAWAWRTLFDHTAHRTGTDAWCSDCGGRIKLAGGELAAALGIDEVECPHCGELLKVKFSRKKKTMAKLYFTVLDTHKGYQVVRHFLATRSVSCACSWPTRRIDEVAQIWLDEKGNEAVVGLPKIGFSCYYDAWSLAGGMAIREHGSSYRGDRFTIFGDVAPRPRVLPIYRKHGYTRRCEAMPADRLLRTILTDNRAETLIKQKQYDLLSYFFWQRWGSMYGRYAKAINICTRHGYIVKDASMWCDYIDLLRYFAKDDRNPQYICPKSLKKSHDELLKRKRVIEAREAAERSRREEEERKLRNEKLAKEYVKRVAKVVAVKLSNSSLQAWVLPTVEAFREEGEAMHHCVFENNYFAHKDTLILTVRDNKGKRLATIELNTKSWQIVQCRGVNNSVPKRDEEIRLFLTKNINKLKEAV